MGILDRLFNRPPSQEKFAKIMLGRIRASGDTRPIVYDSDAFRLVRGDSKITFLGNVYQEYLRRDASEREELIRRFLAMWYTTDLPVPEEFDDVKADILPALRARSYFEIDLQLASDGDATPPPYETIGEHLALSLVYDLPDSMMTISDGMLEKWNISFYEAMEVARQNLREKPVQAAQIGRVYALANGDGYDATRMILLDLLRQFDVEGDAIAMLPNRERLYVAGSADEEGLEVMLKLVGEDLQNERFISGMAFRLEGDDWLQWLPPREHKLYKNFHDLRLATIARTYSDQAALLNKQHQRSDKDIFVATYSGLTDEATGETSSYCMWAEGIDSLLPETDQVMFTRPTGDGISMAARGDWQQVAQLAGDLMEPQGIYPERWRVREFPSQAVLDKIGNK
jgi:hypothetical protein